MSTSANEMSPDPDLIGKLWDRAELLKKRRAALAETETEVQELINRLEQLNLPIIEILKICNEPLIVSLALLRGRFSGLRSFIDIYGHTCFISREISKQGIN
jgi:hypothetical protein